MPSSANRLWTSLFAAAVAAATPSAAEVLLAEGGRAIVPIVLARDASLPERTAARELVDHLERATGARFTITTEGAGDDGGAAILVGPTERAFIIEGLVIPEPASLSLLVLGGLAMLRRRRNRA